MAQQEAVGTNLRQRVLEKKSDSSFMDYSTFVSSKGGIKVADRVTHFAHFSCLPAHLVLVYKTLLRVPTKMLNLSACRSTFEQVLQLANTNYLSQNTSFISRPLVSANSISLPSQKFPIIPLLSVLPYEVSRFYSSETNLVKTDSESWHKASLFPPKLRMPRPQYHLLLLRMYKLGMVEWLGKSEVLLVNGVHCVVKANNKQRLIFDGRAVNSVFLEPSSVQLPSYALLEDWYLSADETAVMAKLDIDNYYHRLGVPKWMSKYLAMPPVSTSDIHFLDPSLPLPSTPLLFPTCVTLPMGLAHAVLLAQLAHLSFISALPSASLINTHVHPTAELWVFIYIDDVIIVSKHRQINKAKRNVNKLLKQFLLQYQQHGLVVNQQKVMWAASHGEALGCTFNGEKGFVSPVMNKLTNIVRATKYLLTLTFVRHKWVEKLLGAWVWFLLLRRPLFSVLVNVYKFLRVVSTIELVPLWKSVRQEFEVLICFSELCVLDWRRITHPFLCAIDASSFGAGACTRQVPSAPSIKLDPSLLLQLSASFSKWNKLFSFKWQVGEHINILEARALVHAITQLPILSSCHRQRLRLILDSQVLQLPSSERFAAGLKPATISLYRRTLQKAFDVLGDVNPTNIDDQLVHYVELAPSSSRKSLAEKLICAVKHFFPHLSLNLSGLSRFLKLLKKEFPSATKPPMIEEVVIRVVAQLIIMKFPTTALAVYAQFDLYLRPAEICAIKTEHFLFPGGNILGQFTGKVILVLPHTKTGPLQSVDVRIPLLQKLLARLVASASATQLLFPTYRLYAQRLASALYALHLSSIGYTPHSIRHGAATADLLRGGYQKLPAILYRGRWESNAGKHYIQMGAALLLSAKLPPDFVSHAVQVKDFLEAMFNAVTLQPGL